MATATKLVQIRTKRANSPLTPELREFIDAAVVPLLVKKYLRESEKTLEVVRPQGQNRETK